MENSLGTKEITVLWSRCGADCREREKGRFVKRRENGYGLFGFVVPNRYICMLIRACMHCAHTGLGKRTWIRAPSGTFRSLQQQSCGEYRTCLAARLDRNPAVSATPRRSPTQPREGTQRKPRKEAQRKPPRRNPTEPPQRNPTQTLEELQRKPAKDPNRPPNPTNPQQTL